MDDVYYYSASITNDRALYISPLTDRQAEASGYPLEDASGYFLYERRGSSEVANKITILAQIPNEEAAFALSRLLKME